MKAKQLSFLNPVQKSYGGELMKKRKGRRLGGRPISSRESMHLVLRSSQARGTFSFKTTKNERAIRVILKKFCEKYAVHVYSLANVGNHLHFHLKFSHRRSYKPFIRAITSAIAMAVTGANRWGASLETLGMKKFWDYRPFSRIVSGGIKCFLGLKDYVSINVLEGRGIPRAKAQILIRGHGPPRAV